MLEEHSQPTIRRPPIVPSLCPYRVHLRVGRSYKYCSCGRSKKQPWCDESHLTTDPQPIEFTISTAQTYHWLCGCKYSSNQPWCDGSHIHVQYGTEELQQSTTNTTSTNTENI